MQDKRQWKATFLLLPVIAVLLAADQLSKLAAIVRLKGQASIVLIPGVLELRYLENRGMAFGLLQNQLGFFLAVTILCLVVFGYAFWRIPKSRYYTPLIAVLLVLTSGALGNLCDRLVRGFVVDFIYFSLIDFPIFNLADIYVVTALFAFLILHLFYYEERDYAFLIPTKLRGAKE